VLASSEFERQVDWGLPATGGSSFFLCAAVSSPRAVAVLGFRGASLIRSGLAEQFTRQNQIFGNLSCLTFKPVKGFDANQSRIVVGRKRPRLRAWRCGRGNDVDRVNEFIVTIV
jgi:hypothetical protein